MTNHVYSCLTSIIRNTVDRAIFAVKIFSRLPENTKNFLRSLFNSEQLSQQIVMVLYVRRVQVMTSGYSSRCAVVMALHRCFYPRNGLPAPKGSISSVIPSQAVAQANQEVVGAMQVRAHKKIFASISVCEIILREDFSREIYLTQKFPDVR